MRAGGKRLQVYGRVAESRALLPRGRSANVLASQAGDVG
jgi:hypothetical protein